MLLWMVLWVVTTGGSLWTPYHHVAAIVLGENVLTPSQAISLPVVLTGTLVHLVLAVFYTIVLAFIIHRWGFIVGVLGGALYGFALYLINYYTFTWLYPWFFPLRSWIALAGCVFFGAAAGGLYEWMERDLYIGEKDVSSTTI